MEKTTIMDLEKGDCDVDADDPALRRFLQFNLNKHSDLLEMLGTNRDSSKLEAMKQVIIMIARGKDASELFPAVVKNVASKNIELKKLIYMYLARYAEERQDLALLSISTFQRALKEPNQLIRASALRTLSNIRVSAIAPIVFLAIKEAITDMSPYVRKTAAHAIPKLYRLSPEHKPELISAIQKLLNDRTVFVMASAVIAFNEVCPDDFEPIHGVFRKLCALLVDVDEWALVIILNVLTRYVRTQFLDPNMTTSTAIDPDHRLLLKSALPLLQSHNAAVVMAVAQLYHHCAPQNEAAISTRALIRLLHSHVEIQCLVLDNIVSLTTQDSGAFAPYLKNFLVRSTDPTKIKLLKVEIITHLVTPSNVSAVLNELRTHVTNDSKLTAAAIKAIGRCAHLVPEVSETCLSELVGFLSSKNKRVVAESVPIVIHLLKTRPKSLKHMIECMCRLLDSVKAPQARAAIIWLVGEHLDDAATTAPDVLRVLCKTFLDEDDLVKLQVLNLAVKICVENEAETGPLARYVYTLAKYDQNFDIRDKVRLLRRLTVGTNSLRMRSRAIFFAAKPPPFLVFKCPDRAFTLGTLSLCINARAVRYEDLPAFSETLCNGITRDVGEVCKSLSTSSCSSSDDCSESETSSSDSVEEHGGGDAVTGLHFELLDRFEGRGLEVVGCYTRNTRKNFPTMVNVHLNFTNTGSDDIKDILMAENRNAQPFAPISILNPDNTRCRVMAIDFDNSIRPVIIEIVSSKGTSVGTITPKVGELVRPLALSENDFNKHQSRLKGMFEHSTALEVCEYDVTKVINVANVAFVESASPGVYKFAGETLSSSTVLLIGLAIVEECAVLTVNCEDVLIGSLLLIDLKASFERM